MVAGLPVAERRLALALLSSLAFCGLIIAAAGRNGVVIDNRHDDDTKTTMHPQHPEVRRSAF